MGFRTRFIEGTLFSFLILLDAWNARGEEWHFTCRQLVAVVTTGWESKQGRLCRLEEIDSQWIAVGDPIDVTVGKNGLGWGLGLHSIDLPGPVKMEGDKRAPAGVFRLESGFGVNNFKLPNFEYRRTTAGDLWVDDPVSAHYNRWVSTENISQDWSSAEILRRLDGIYDYAIVVGHNRAPIVAGRGSAIFMHSWFGEGIPTIGCTAMARENVKKLLKWLDRSKLPVLVQVPDTELESLVLPVNAALIRNSAEKPRVR